MTVCPSSDSKPTGSNEAPGSGVEEKNKASATASSSSRGFIASLRSRRVGLQSIEEINKHNSIRRGLVLMCPGVGVVDLTRSHCLARLPSLRGAKASTIDILMGTSEPSVLRCLSVKDML